MAAAAWWRWLAKTVKKRSGYHENMDPFRKGIMPLMIVYKAVARFPYQVRDDGKMEVAYLSLAGLYFATVYGVLSAVALDFITGDDIMSYFNLDDFLRTVIGTSAVISIFLHISPLLSVWKSYADLAEYFNEWSEFCVHYERTMGVPFKFKFGKCVLALAIFIAVGTPIVVSNLTSVLYSRQGYHLLLPGADVVAAMVEYSFFGVCCFQLISVASAIDERLKQITDRGHISASELCEIRQIWIGLSHLAQNTGGCLTIPLFIELGTSTAIISFAAFGLISSLILGIFDVLQYVFCLIFVGLRVFLFFEMGERLTCAAGNKISNTVSIMSVTLMGDNAADEYEMLIQSINSNFPTVTVGGLANVSRKALGSMLSAATLYVLVMIQMRVGS